MMRLIRFIFAIIMISGFSLTAAAQTDCPAFAGDVLEHVAALCGDVGQNQLCYGSPSVTVTPAADASDFAFGQPGDRVGVGAVQALQLSPFNLDESAWGVVVMDVQANLPPDQSASYVLFGDVAVDNLGTAIQMEAHVATGNPINARSIPSTRGSVVAILNADASLTVNGRSAGGDWLRVQLDDGSTGWVAAYLLQSDADFAALEIADSDTTGYTPMQAITLKTGAGDTGCAEAPDSGLLVQTPEGDAGITLQVNGVDMQLSGTALLRADADRGLVVNLLEGTGTLHALDKSMIVPAGAVVSVPLDTNLQVNGAPFSPIPYNPENLQGLPLSLLRRPIEVIEPLTVREINRMTACRIMSTVAGTNFREGPATAYFATGTLTQDTPYRVTGWTNGRDGFVWWRVSERHWVRTDI
ncbi:MAG: SH3 domain-containing protein, partial [Anaerolineae bacterium]|nr:SH3 domain-containing protein [Anaerolineae bacterium]